MARERCCDLLGAPAGEDRHLGRGCRRRRDGERAHDVVHAHPRVQRVGANLDGAADAGQTYIPVKEGGIQDQPLVLELFGEPGHALPRRDVDGDRARLLRRGRTDAVQRVLSRGVDCAGHEDDDGDEREQSASDIVGPGSCRHVAVGRGMRAVITAGRARPPFAAQAL